ARGISLQSEDWFLTLAGVPSDPFLLDSSYIPDPERGLQKTYSLGKLRTASRWSSVESRSLFIRFVLFKPP
ncbi:hypothetical protein MMC29_006965, partial [Sticta canariensis]|nr:hypothetical protein [Sticta canariensis]